jgi:hypothetical protein
LWQRFDREMQLSPQALPAEQTLQQAALVSGIGVQGISGVSKSMNPETNSIAPASANVFTVPSQARIMKPEGVGVE